MNWLKNIFSKKEEVTITLDQLPDFFASETKDKLHRAEEQALDLKKEIRQEKEEIDPLLEQLETTPLKNENIHERAKQFMIGNRENYIKQVKLFLNQIPLDEDPREIYAKTEPLLNSLNKSSARSYQILNEFFANEIKVITQKISRIKYLAEKIDKAVNAPELKDVNETKDTINELFRQIELNKKREIEIEELKKEISEATKQKEIIELALQKLNESSQYQEYHEETQRVKDSEAKKARVIDEATQLFSPIQKALKKYQRMTMHNAELMELYTTNIEKALNTDFKWDIFIVLPSVERAIKNNMLDLKDDKQEKTMESISRITKQKLEDYKRRINEAILEKTGAEERLKTNSVMEQKESIELKLINTNTQINTSTVRMNTTKHDLEGPTLKTIKEKLIKQLNRISSKEVMLE